jgi:DNA-directed RNA polymerase specialized sigma24 family protein
MPAARSTGITVARGAAGRLDRATAEDVLQTALVRAYLRWHRIAASPEAYVRRIVVTADRRADRPHLDQPSPPPRGSMPA